MKKKIKVLVTGGTGFIGTHLVTACLKKGYQVRVITRNPVNKKKLEKQGIEVLVGDIRDKDLVFQAVRGMDLVFHLAAVVTDWAPKKDFIEINIRATDFICEACLKYGIKRLIAVSTSDVFGVQENIIINENTGYKYWQEPYPDTKIEAVKIIWEYAKKGLAVTVLYPCWVYGSGDTTFIPLTTDAVKKGELFFWRRKNIIWPVYVHNLVDLLLKASSHPQAKNEGFLVHDGEYDTFEEFAEKIAGSIGVKAPALHLPYQLAYGMAMVMEFFWFIFRIKTRPLLTTYTIKNFGSRLHFSIQKAKRLLNWTPPVSYQQGFKESMEWLKKTNPAFWKQK